MDNGDKEVTLTELQIKTDAVISRLQTQLEERQNQIILAAAALITAAAIGYWWGRRK